MLPPQLHVGTHLLLRRDWITLFDRLDKMQVIGGPDSLARRHRHLTDKPLQKMELLEFFNETLTAAHLRDLQMNFLINADRFLLLRRFHLFGETSQFRYFAIAGVKTRFANGLHLNCLAKDVFFLKHLAIDRADPNPLTNRAFRKSGSLKPRKRSNCEYLADLIPLGDLLLRQPRTGWESAHDNVITKLLEQHHRLRHLYIQWSRFKWISKGYPKGIHF